MKQRRAEQIQMIVSQAVSRASGRATDVAVIGEPNIGALCEGLAGAGAQVATYQSATAMPASFCPAVVVDARSAPVDSRVADLLVSLTRLAPGGIYVAAEPFAAGAHVGSRHLTLFDAIQAIAGLVAGGLEPARGAAVLRGPDVDLLEPGASPMEVRAFFEQTVAAVEVLDGLVVVRRSETAVSPVDPIDAADLPPGPAFEARRLSGALGADGLADLAFERFDRRVVAEIDILKRRLAQRDRDLAELRDALKRSMARRPDVRTASGPGIVETVVAATRATARSSDFRDRMRLFERSMRKVWKDPLALLGKPKTNKPKTKR